MPWKTPGVLVGGAVSWCNKCYFGGFGGFWFDAGMVARRFKGWGWRRDGTGTETVPALAAETAALLWSLRDPGGLILGCGFMV